MAYMHMPAIRISHRLGYFVNPPMSYMAYMAFGHAYGHTNLRLVRSVFTYTRCVQVRSVWLYTQPIGLYLRICTYATCQPTVGQAVYTAYVVILPTVGVALQASPQTSQIGLWPMCLCSLTYGQLPSHVPTAHLTCGQAQLAYFK